MANLRRWKLLKKKSQMLGKQYYIRDKEFLCIVDTKESVNLKIEVTRIEHKEKK